MEKRRGKVEKAEDKLLILALGMSLLLSLQVFWPLQSRYPELCARHVGAIGNTWPGFKPLALNSKC